MRGQFRILALCRTSSVVWKDDSIHETNIRFADDIFMKVQNHPFMS